MSVALFTHPDMMEHRPGAGHPERPERLRAVLDALDDAGLSGDRRAATEASIADLERLHPVAVEDDAVLVRCVEHTVGTGLSELGKERNELGHAGPRIVDDTRSPVAGRARTMGESHRVGVLHT